MATRTKLIIAALCFVIAGVVGTVAYVNFSRMVTTAEVVTPGLAIPAGALIEPAMLKTREVPRPLLDEDVYVRAAELAGRVAVVPLAPGMVVYRPFAVSQEQYRLTGDPTLAVVSFPVDPSRAIGGQLQPGHRVDVWRLVGVRPTSGLTLTEVASADWATATLLVHAAPVVDVRAGSGVAVARSPQALPGQLDDGDGQKRSAGGTLQIVTVAVDPGVAQEILALVAEEQAGVDLWVSLSPLASPSPVTASVQREDE
jgi:hypothetical protein